MILWSFSLILHCRPAEILDKLSLLVLVNLFLLDREEVMLRSLEYAVLNLDSLVERRVLHVLAFPNVHGVDWNALGLRSVEPSSHVEEAVYLECELDSSLVLDLVAHLVL